jgi:tight adherence protein B
MLNQFPDAMDLLARAVHAGESLDQALTLAGDAGTEPLATEFRRSAGQLEMGLSLDAAMRTFTRRVPLMESRIFAAAALVQRQSGGNLGLTLDRLAAAFRDRLNYRRQFRAMTAAARGGAILIAIVAVLISVYVLIFRRDYLQAFLESNLGLALLISAIVAQIIGVAWALWLLRTSH